MANGFKVSPAQTGKRKFLSVAIRKLLPGMYSAELDSGMQGRRAQVLREIIDF